MNKKREQFQQKSLFLKKFDDDFIQENILKYLNELDIYLLKRCCKSLSNLKLLPDHTKNMNKELPITFWPFKKIKMCPFCASRIRQEQDRWPFLYGHIRCCQNFIDTKDSIFINEEGKEISSQRIFDDGLYLKGCKYKGLFHSKGQSAENVFNLDFRKEFDKDCSDVVQNFIKAEREHCLHEKWCNNKSCVRVGISKHIYLYRVYQKMNLKITNSFEKDIKQSRENCESLRLWFSSKIKPMIYKEKANRICWIDVYECISHSSLKRELHRLKDKSFIKKIKLEIKMNLYKYFLKYLPKIFCQEIIEHLSMNCCACSSCAKLNLKICEEFKKLIMFDTITFSSSYSAVNMPFADLPFRDLKVQILYIEKCKKALTELYFFLKEQEMSDVANVLPLFYKSVVNNYSIKDTRKKLSHLLHKGFQMKEIQHAFNLRGILCIDKTIKKLKIKKKYSF